MPLTLIYEETQLISMVSQWNNCYKTLSAAEYDTLNGINHDNFLISQPNPMM